VINKDTIQNQTEIVERDGSTVKEINNSISKSVIRINNSICTPYQLSSIVIRIINSIDDNGTVKEINNSTSFDGEINNSIGLVLEINNTKYELYNLNAQDYEGYDPLIQITIEYNMRGFVLCAIDIIKDKGDCERASREYGCDNEDSNCPWGGGAPDCGRCDNSGNTYRYDRAIKYLYRILGEQQTKELLVEVLI